MPTIAGYTALAMLWLALTNGSGLVTALTGAVRLPMEVFGSNTTTDEAANATASAAASLETRKAVLRQKVLLMRSEDALAERSSGLDRLEELESGDQRQSDIVHGARILYQIGVCGKLL